MRKRKRLSKLKSELLIEAKKEKYFNLVKKNIRKLNDKKTYYFQLALNAKEDSDSSRLNHFVRQCMFIDEHIEKLHKIYDYLESLQISSDVKEVYDGFISFVDDHEFSDYKAQKKKGLKRIFRRHRKQVSEVQEYFDYIDRLIRKISKKSSDVVSNQKPLKNKEIDSYINAS